MKMKIKPSFMVYRWLHRPGCWVGTHNELAGWFPGLVREGRLNDYTIKKLVRTN